MEEKGEVARLGSWISTDAPPPAAAHAGTDAADPPVQPHLEVVLGAVRGQGGRRRFACYLLEKGRKE
jgi:hypothetical protein